MPTVHDDLSKRAAAIFHGTNINDASGSTVQFLGGIHYDPTDNSSTTIAIGAPDDSSDEENGGAVYLLMNIDN